VSYTPSPQEAAKELLSRQRASESLTEFARYVDAEHPPAQHHELLCSALDEITAGTLKRLMVFMPPGSAKSHYTSVKFPAYYLGRHRDHGVIAGSYNDDLAGSFGRKVRNLVDADEYANIFELELAQDSRARGEWETDDGGFYFAVGVGGGVTGRRADLLLADDLIRGRKDADSESLRNSTWDWWLSDFRTRGKPGYALVLIMTRWHEDDVAGRILPDDWAGQSGWVKAKDGEEWFVICLPAQAEENDILGRAKGEWLWPEWFGTEFWELTQATQPPRNWSCLYQQRPTATDGTFYRRAWFPQSDTRPERMNVYMAGDFAVTEDGGDFTELGVFGVGPDEHVYALDWWHGRTTADEWIERWLELVDRWDPLWFLGETGPIKRAIEPILLKRMRETKTSCAIEWLTHSAGSKEAMARPFQAISSMGRVHFPNTPWAERVIDQLLRFPTGKYDDAVDVCSLFGRFIDRTWKALPKPKREVTLAEAVTAKAQVSTFMPTGMQKILKKAMKR